LVHRRTRRGGGSSPPGLKIFRANSVFRASANCSKILNDKKYFNTMKNFRATLFFRASASCSKFLNDKKYFNTAKNFRATLFSGQAQVAENSLMIKNISIQRKISG